MTKGATTTGSKLYVSNTNTPSKLKEIDEVPNPHSFYVNNNIIYTMSLDEDGIYLYRLDATELSIIAREKV